MNALSAKIYAPSGFNTDESASLFFELTNNTNKLLHILKWYTPLEGLKSDCLHVLKNGKPVAYDGRLVKRGKPGPGDFITLKPGESVNEKINVGEAYHIAKAGKIKVSFKPDKLFYAQQAPTAKTLLAGPALQTKQRSLKIISRAAEFNMSGKTAPSQTAGERARKLERKNNPASKKKIRPRITQSLIAAALPCKVRGGTTARKNIVKLAHQNGYTITVETFNSMAKNKQYSIWFGAYAKPRFSKVRSDYQKIKNDFEKKVFTYSLHGSDCDPGDYAYTYKGTTTIWLCSGFWSAPHTGADSQAGTMVHEHSHASAYTDDNGYGETDCKKLAKTDPAKAIRNADSHEYYSRG